MAIVADSGLISMKWRKYVANLLVVMWLFAFSVVCIVKASNVSVSVAVAVPVSCLGSSAVKCVAAGCQCVWLWRNGAARLSSMKICVTDDHSLLRDPTSYCWYIDILFKPLFWEVFILPGNSDWCEVSIPEYCPIYSVLFLMLMMIPFPLPPCWLLIHCWLMTGSPFILCNLLLHYSDLVFLTLIPEVTWWLIQWLMMIWCFCVTFIHSFSDTFCIRILLLWYLHCWCDLFDISDLFYILLERVILLWKLLVHLFWWCCYHFDDSVYIVYDVVFVRWRVLIPVMSDAVIPLLMQCWKLPMMFLIHLFCSIRAIVLTLTVGIPGVIGLFGIVIDDAFHSFDGLHCSVLILLTLWLFNCDYVVDVDGHYDLMIPMPVRFIRYLMYIDYIYSV